MPVLKTISNTAVCLLVAFQSFASESFFLRLWKNEKTFPFSVEKKKSPMYISLLQSLNTAHSTVCRCWGKC